MNANLRNFALWVIIVLLLLALFSLFQNPSQRQVTNDISFSQLLSEVDNGKVKDVVIQGHEITGHFTDGRQFQTYAPSDPSLDDVWLPNGSPSMTPATAAAPFKLKPPLKTARWRNSRWLVGGRRS